MACSPSPLASACIMPLSKTRASPEVPSLASDGTSGEARVFDKGMMQALAKGLGEQAIVRHGAGTVLFKEGSAGALAYVVLEGRVAVSIQGKTVERIGAG